MDEIKLQLINNDDDEVVKESTGLNSTYIEHHHHYKKGDLYRVTVSSAPCYLIVQMDAAVKPALVYITTQQWDYEIPFNEQREWIYTPSAFQTRDNYSTVRYATRDEINSYRNVAENSYDQHHESNGFPHAKANVETRGESAFYCKNAIDGIVANESHGNFPFESWGTGGRKDAEMVVDYGRKVKIDKVAFIIRADFPHDTNWKSVSLEYSDGSIETFNLKKTADRQMFDISEREVSWIKLFNLIEDDDPTTFSALTQLETFGKDVIE